MPELASAPETRTRTDQDCLRRESLKGAIDQAAALLPIPGPITAFAFLNTLQALEDLPFDEGMRRGAQLYGAQPYLPEDRYRAHLARGRIRPEDVLAALMDDLGDSADTLIGSLGTRFELRLTMLLYAMPFGPDEELEWFIVERDALSRFHDEVPRSVRERFVEETRRWVLRDLRDQTGRDQTGHGQRGLDAVAPMTASPGATDRVRTRNVLADLIPKFSPSSIEHWNDPVREWESLSLQVLWRVCYDGALRTRAQVSAATEWPMRHRDLLREATGVDSDSLVHEMLIRMCAAFTDQGFAHWQLPDRIRGFYRAFFGLYRRPKGPPDRWLRGLAAELSRLEAAELDPLDSIQESLELLGVDQAERDEFLTTTLLALRGWAGMLWQMDVRRDRVPAPVPPGTLIEFLAVRLVLDRLAVAYVARDALNYDGPLSSLRDFVRRQLPPPHSASVEQRALLIFELAQLRVWTPPELFRMSDHEWQMLVSELEAFGGIERRSVLHRAFERRLQVAALDALAIHAIREPYSVAAPRFQAAFCIDAREESFRRHLEEVAPDVETFGLAGFFGVAMYYRGAADAHFAALCPIVVQPKHWVVEDVVFTLEETHRRRAKTRWAMGTATHQLQAGTRSMAGGALLAAVFGVLASIPLVARVLFPRFTARLRRLVGRLIEPPPMTRLRLERSTVNPGPEEEQVGFSLDEMAGIGERMLRDIGLTSGFSRLVIFLGHGSSALNNPHKSAYDCGACAGSPGGPNGRALAAILNDQRVRDVLAKHGLTIPNDTVFVGGLHNTAVDAITFYDLDFLPKSHFHDFEGAVRSLEEACERNAHERCRRFDSAPVDLSFAAAHQHVEGRSEDLAQTRPEFGNATNAFCFVGRRSRTRGLFLDRRCFMSSYDPTQDDAESAILARILSAVVPVCEGINMQYYLSSVDSPGWACGTKLPHNVASLLGVMDGAGSDLRPGLPWQGVEIHESVRCTFIIETTPEAMLKIMERNPTINRILRNGWALLAVLSPNSNQIQVFKTGVGQNGEFRAYSPGSVSLPSAASSTDWYRGWRDHLGFAAINGHLSASNPRATSNPIASS